jgi:hypothetical protein
MNKQIFLALILTLSFTTSAFSQVMTTRFGLQMVIKDRCGRYLKSADKDLCKKSVDAILEELDFDVKILDEASKSFVFMAFQKNLVKILSQSQTHDFLKGYQAELTKYLLNHTLSPVNLWDYSVKFYSSEEKALEVIAALFQDTSERKLHLAYIHGTRDYQNESFQKNADYLGLVIDTMDQVQKSGNGEIDGLLFYPKGFQENRNVNMYHFYIPAYLTSRLMKMNRGARSARLGPLMMSVTYEFVTAGKDKEFLFDDPQKIDGSTAAGLWKITDIYGGYSGGLFGLKLPSQVKDFQSVKTSFTRSSQAGMELLLRE